MEEETITIPVEEYLLLQKVICDKMREGITLEVVAQTFGGLK